ncbi:MAG: hypothetical protein KF862_24510 [Chitinophagaceae bacterium]|nr:hypothetical protein [Chitinophagaceae bacterium]
MRKYTCFAIPKTQYEAREDSVVPETALQACVTSQAGVKYDKTMTKMAAG